VFIDVELFRKLEKFLQLGGFFGLMQLNQFLQFGCLR